MLYISVIICTYNPRPDYLLRVLEALKAQSFCKERWELLLVDNASKEPLVEKFDLSWHPNACTIREDDLGLTPARLRGIKESSGACLVFVDDDNLLASDYLANANNIANLYPHLGAWAGQVDGQFEAPLPVELDPFKFCLALANVPSDVWSNSYEAQGALPFGAGMCIRRSVASAYLEACKNDPRKKMLDRAGSTLCGAGDVDMAYTALDIGYGMGRFSSLRLTHLIPRHRSEPTYLERLAEGGQYSSLLLRYFRKMPVQLYVPRRDHIKFWLDYYAQSAGYRRLMIAQKRGSEAARRFILQDQIGAGNENNRSTQ